jgi:hypothetical protein
MLHKKITIFVIEIRFLFLYDSIRQMMVKHYPTFWIGRYSQFNPAVKRIFISVFPKNTI